MKLSFPEERPVSAPEFLQGGGELGQRIRAFDWSKTPLGPVDTWPQSLRTVVSICLNSNFPIAIYWSKNLTLLYNDAWSSIPGNKHPWALGRTARDVWPDIWEAIEPQFEKTFNGEPGGSNDALLPMHRHGYTEECYFDFTFTPVYGEEGKVEGVFNAVIETTYRVINERRTAFLKDFAITIADAKSKGELYRETINFIGSDSRDISFALYFTIDHFTAELKASTLTEEENEIFRSRLPLPELIEAGKSTCFNNLKLYLVNTPRKHWPEEVTQAYAISIAGADGSMVGLLVCGLSARRHFDEEYKVFLESIGSAVSTVLQTIDSLEEQRKKAEALSEIDRAKTTFFSNISHEFRTPLTLLLGPIEDALNDPKTIPANKQRMEVAHRNALRMQKLVNSLLDFSRIEAGRMEGKFSAVDICALTQELASNFRSAVEKAGMQLKFECEKISNIVYVDVDMWEKIVLNLVSNAFKYTRHGSITIKIMEASNKIQLSVCDTGVGIPKDQLDKVFDRFHRVENIQGRSQEGTGIGLAMVKELVKLHQGTITVESELGKGSTFTVTIPSGREHLPEERIGGAVSIISDYTHAFVQEAMKWNDEEENNKEFVDHNNSKSLVQSEKEKKYTVVLADDNADMRNYVKRLLSEHFNVFTAVDGEDAFHKITHQHPDLVLSDIMMPKLDGVGLLNKIRNHPDLKSLPVILLSARAGEEAKVEGLDAGADDYLVKPFSAKELLAKVSSQIKINRLRFTTLQNIYNMFDEVPFAVSVLKGQSLVIEFINRYNLKLWDRSKEQVLGKPLFEVFPGRRESSAPIHEEIYRTGKRFAAKEIPIDLLVDGKLETRYFNALIDPLRDESGDMIGQIATSIEVTEFVLARKKIEESEASLRLLANAVPQLVWEASNSGEVIYYNDRVSEFAGATRTADGNWRWEGLVHPDDLQATEKEWKDAVKKGSVYQIEHRIQMKDGSYRWFLSRAYPHKDDQHNVVKWFGSATDIHAAKMHAAILEEEVKKRTMELNESNKSLIQSNNELQQFAHVASHDLKEPVRKIKTFTNRLMDDQECSFSEMGKLYLQKVNAAADRMNVMIEGVLNYSMLNASHKKIEDVDLNEIVKHIESDLELLIAQKHAAIYYDHLPTLHGASVLLYQLFYNLLNNSIKFSKADAPPRIDIAWNAIIQNQKDFAQITIKDNGIGFEQQFAEKIFETFLRLNSKDVFEGTGLGLSLCKRIAERHGGSIEAFGDPDNGSRFVILLPFKQEKGLI